jgi:hypothetical protein
MYKYLYGTLNSHAMGKSNTKLLMTYSPYSENKNVHKQTNKQKAIFATHIQWLDLDT